MQILTLVSLIKKILHINTKKDKEKNKKNVNFYYNDVFLE